MIFYVRDILNRDIFEVELYKKENHTEVCSTTHIKESLNFALNLYSSKYYSKKHCTDFIEELDTISSIKCLNKNSDKSFQEIKDEVETVCRKFSNKYKLYLVKQEASI